jgi:hypothetical protein
MRGTAPRISRMTQLKKLTGELNHVIEKTGANDDGANKPRW